LNYSNILFYFLEFETWKRENEHQTFSTYTQDRATSVMEARENFIIVTAHIDTESKETRIKIDGK